MSKPGGKDTSPGALVRIQPGGGNEVAQLAIGHKSLRRLIWGVRSGFHTTDDGSESSAESSRDRRDTRGRLRVNLQQKQLAVSDQGSVSPAHGEQQGL